MKHILAVFLLFVTIAPNIHSQMSPQRRAVGDRTLVTGGAPGLADPDGRDLRLGRLRGSTPVDPTNKLQPHTSALVSASQLNIPPKAVKEFERFQKAFQSGDVHSSAAHLQKAL